MAIDNDLDFSDLPPFPTDVPTAPLLRLSLQKLLNNDTHEIRRLYDTCCDVGFFYLDLRNAASPELLQQTNGNKANDHSTNESASPSINGNSLIQDAEGLFEVAQEFYRLPVEEKARYDFKAQGSYYGYKGYGSGIIDKTGTKDRNEFYNVSWRTLFAS